MSIDRPIPMRWTAISETASGFVPLNSHWAREADKQLVVGEVYRLTTVEERSQVSHRQMFAWLKEAWSQLPENLAMEYPSPEALRKRGLISAGFYDEQIIDAGSKAAAVRVAAAIRSIDEFALVFVRGIFVIRRTAKSQSMRAMGKADFQASKQALLEVVAAMIGVTPERLTANAGTSAS